MKNTELDVIYNLLLDMGLTLRKLTESSSKHESFFEKQKKFIERQGIFNEEQRSFNERSEKKVDKLERSQAKTNLMLQQVNMSTMKLAEDSKRIDNVEQRLKN